LFFDDNIVVLLADLGAEATLCDLKVRLASVTALRLANSAAASAIASSVINCGLPAILFMK
jgi:hypothetical protein